MTNMIINNVVFWQAVFMFVFPWTFGWFIGKFMSLDDLNYSKKRGREGDLVLIIVILSIGVVILSIICLMYFLMIIGDA